MHQSRSLISALVFTLVSVNVVWGERPSNNTYYQILPPIPASSTSTITAEADGSVVLAGNVGRINQEFFLDRFKDAENENESLFHIRSRANRHYLTFERRGDRHYAKMSAIADAKSAFIISESGPNVLIRAVGVENEFNAKATGSDRKIKGYVNMVNSLGLGVTTAASQSTRFTLHAKDPIPVAEVELGGIYVIESRRAPGLVLDVTASSHDVGAFVILYPRTGNPNQQFRFESWREEENAFPRARNYRIVSVNSGKAIGYFVITSEIPGSEFAQVADGYRGESTRCRYSPVEAGYVRLLFGQSQFPMSVRDEETLVPTDTLRLGPQSHPKFYGSRDFKLIPIADEKR